MYHIIINKNFLAYLKKGWFSRFLRFSIIKLEYSKVPPHSTYSWFSLLLFVFRAIIKILLWFAWLSILVILISFICFLIVDVILRFYLFFWIWFISILYWILIFYSFIKFIWMKIVLILLILTEFSCSISIIIIAFILICLLIKTFWGWLSLQMNPIIISCIICTIIMCLNILIISTFFILPCRISLHIEWIQIYFIIISCNIALMFTSSIFLSLLCYNFSIFIII